MILIRGPPFSTQTIAGSILGRSPPRADVVERQTQRSLKPPLLTGLVGSTPTVRTPDSNATFTNSLDM